MRILSKFVADEGYKISSEFGDLTLGFLGISKPGKSFNDKQAADFCDAYYRYVAGTSEFALKPKIEAHDAISNVSNQDHAGAIFKYVKNDDWEDHYSRGSIKIDRVESYTSEEYGADRQDFWEGFATAFVADNNREAIVGFQTAPAAHIFCSTSKDYYCEELAERFGSKFLKIKNPKKFFQIVAEKTGTKYLYNKSMIYNNLKAVRYQERFFSDRISILRSSISDEGPVAITGNKRRFVLRLLEKTRDIAVLSKPRVVCSEDGSSTKVFEVEEEVRAAFASSADKRQPLFTGDCPELADLMELVK